MRGWFPGGVVVHVTFASFATAYCIASGTFPFRVDVTVHFLPSDNPKNLCYLFQVCC